MRQRGLSFVVVAVLALGVSGSLPPAAPADAQVVTIPNVGPIIGGVYTSVTCDYYDVFGPERGMITLRAHNFFPHHVIVGALVFDTKARRWSQAPQPFAIAPRQGGYFAHSSSVVEFAPRPQTGYMVYVFVWIHDGREWRFGWGGQPHDIASRFNAMNRGLRGCVI